MVSEVVYVLRCLKKIVESVFQALLVEKRNVEDSDVDNSLSIKGIFKNGEKQGKLNFFFRNLFLTFVVQKVDRVLMRKDY